MAQNPSYESVAATDGFPLAARFFAPAEAPRAAVLIASAMGTPPAPRGRACARYAAVATPLVSLSFTDDEYMSLANTRALHALYSGAPQTLKRIAPAEIGQKRIGHFGFFRAQHEHALWRPHLLPELA